MEKIEDDKKEALKSIHESLKDGKDVLEKDVDRAIKDLELDEDICAIILRRKLESLIRTVNFKYGWFKSMPDEVQNVIIEMCYQLGVSGFGKFVKTIGYLQTFQFEKAADEMLDSRWAKQTPNRAKALSDIVRCA